MSTSIRCYKVLNILKSDLRAWASYYVDEIAWSNCRRSNDADTLNLNCICLSKGWCGARVSCCHFYVISSLVYFFSSFPIEASIVKELIEKFDREVIVASDYSCVYKAGNINTIITRAWMSEYSNVLLFQLNYLVVKLIDNIGFKVCWGSDIANTASDLHINF